MPSEYSEGSDEALCCGTMESAHLALLIDWKFRLTIWINVLDLHRTQVFEFKAVVSIQYLPKVYSMSRLILYK